MRDEKRLCTIPNCGRPKLARGLCGGHYQRLRKHGNARASVPLNFGGYGRASTRNEVQKAKRKPTNMEIAWAAGFLEGDGTFTRKRVSGYQKTTEPLERLQTIFGGTLREYQRGYWEWFATGARARGVMLTLYTFLSERRRKQLLPAISRS